MHGGAAELGTDGRKAAVVAGNLGRVGLDHGQSQRAVTQGEAGPARAVVGRVIRNPGKERGDGDAELQQRGIVEVALRGREDAVTVDVDVYGRLGVAKAALHVQHIEEFEGNLAGANVEERTAFTVKGDPGQVTLFTQRRTGDTAVRVKVDHAGVTVRDRVAIESDVEFAVQIEAIETTQASVAYRMQGRVAGTGCCILGQGQGEIDTRQVDTRGIFGAATGARETVNAAAADEQVLGREFLD